MALRAANTPSQGLCLLQGFTGLCKESHLSLRVLGHGNHPQRQTSAVYLTCNELSNSRRDVYPGIRVHACWRGDDETFVSEERGTTEFARPRSSINQQAKTIEKSPSECCGGLKEAARYARNDARIVNARAREGFVLLARGFERLDKRARQDVALIGSGFLKLDARAREDTVKLDIDARRNVARLQSVAMVLKDEAEIQLKIAAEKHWSDGALDADLRLADLRAKRRAMEDAYMALQFVKSIHNGLVKRAYQREKDLADIPDNKSEQIDAKSAVVDRLAALQDAYWDIASAVAEADGIDYSDPEELELIIATLLDMDAVDGASSATMLAECANSPDVATRQALANALGNAPSLFSLGNAGMGALERLSKDINPAVAAAASKALEELKKQWQIDTKDSLVFRADSSYLESLYPNEDEEENF